MADLYVMCGIPGSGKSTYLKHVGLDAVVVSRDEIRFSIVKPEEDYFSHEDEVLDIFWNKINENLIAGKDVYVDQTSLTPGARKKLLKHVTGYDYVSCIWIDTDLKTCLERNETRKGTRSYVPRGVIRRMYEQFVEPSLDEGFDYIFHYDSKENKITYKGGVV
jgi:predicted kinase